MKWSRAGTARPTQEIGHRVGSLLRLCSSHATTRPGRNRTSDPTITVGIPSSRRRGIWRSEQPRNLARSFVVQSRATTLSEFNVSLVMPMRAVSTRGTQRPERENCKDEANQKRDPCGLASGDEVDYCVHGLPLVSRFDDQTNLLRRPELFGRWLRLGS